MKLTSLIVFGTPCGWCLLHQSILAVVFYPSRLPHPIYVVLGVLEAFCSCGRWIDSSGSTGPKAPLPEWMSRTLTIAEDEAKAARPTRIASKRGEVTTCSKLELLQRHATLTLRSSKHVLPSYCWKCNAILILHHNKHIDRMLLQKLDGAKDSLRRPDDKYSTNMLLLFAAVDLSTLPSSPTWVTPVALRFIFHGWCGRDEFAVDEVSAPS